MKTSFNWNTRALRWAGSFALVAALAACGGGGGDGGLPPPILDPVNNANAIDDTFPAIQSAAGGSTTAVQLNDTVTINGTTTAAVLGTNASIAAVTRTSAAPAAGSIALNTSTGEITVAAGTSAGAYAFSYQLCRTAPNQTLCDVATASGSVTATAPASDLATSADIRACPRADNLLRGIPNWSNCLAGKRFVGRDTIVAAQACELRILANGGAAVTHNGVNYVTSPAGAAAIDGFYQNTTYEPLGPQILAGVLFWTLNGSDNSIQLVDLSIDLNSNGLDTLEVDIKRPGGGTPIKLNCTLNNI
jgi:hypothetical protein